MAIYPEDVWIDNRPVRTAQMLLQRHAAIRKLGPVPGEDGAQAMLLQRGESFTWRRKVGLHTTWGLDEIHTRFPKKPWETMNTHYFLLIFHENRSNLIENQ